MLLLHQNSKVSKKIQDFFKYTGYWKLKQIYTTLAVGSLRVTYELSVDISVK